MPYCRTCCRFGRPMNRGELAVAYGKRPCDLVLTVLQEMDIALAAQYGVGVMDTLSAQIREIGQPDFVKIPPQGRSELDRLKEYILDRQACSACYGSTLYALQRLSETNQLSRLRKKICVGQGYRGLRMSDLGIGVCTRGFQSFVNGCPPKARDIFEFLQSSLS